MFLQKHPLSRDFLGNLPEINAPKVLPALSGETWEHACGPLWRSNEGGGGGISVASRITYNAFGGQPVSRTMAAPPPPPNALCVIRLATLVGGGGGGWNPIPMITHIAGRKCDTAYTWDNFMSALKSYDTRSVSNRLHQPPDCISSNRVGNYL